MREDGFRFSHNKRFKIVSFEEFLATARTLCDTVSAIRSSVDIEVVTAEDHETYNYTTTTFWSEEIREALEKRKQYSLDELTQEVWDRSFDVQVSLKTVRDEQNPEPFMVCVSCDKYADAKRMKFYGQCLDERTHQEVVNKFRRWSLSHGIGDGMGKISTFNMIMGQSLTGIRLPIR
ncbi:MAG: hypothetical protein Q8R36_00695 [bacterium]|nr:hypothetical protein [bacterium]